MAQVMKSRMAFHGVTQAEMAEAIHVSQSQLSKILRADRTIDLESFQAFCEALDERATDLVKAGEEIARQQHTLNPSEYVPAASKVFVERGSRLTEPKTPADSTALADEAEPDWLAMAAKHGDIDAEQEAYEELP